MTNFLINLGVPKLYAGDVSVVLLMLLISIVLIFIVKKTKLGAFIYAIYASYFITDLLSFDFVKTYPGRCIMFLLLVFLLHYILFKPTVIVKLGGRGFMKWIRRVFVSFLAVGLITVIILSWMPANEVVKMLSSFGLKIFTTDIGRLFWATMPLFVMELMRKKD